MQRDLMDPVSWLAAVASVDESPNVREVASRTCAELIRLRAVQAALISRCEQWEASGEHPLDQRLYVEEVRTLLETGDSDASQA